MNVVFPFGIKIVQCFKADFTIEWFWMIARMHSSCLMIVYIVSNVIWEKIECQFSINDQYIVFPHAFLSVSRFFFVSSFLSLVMFLKDALVAPNLTIAFESKLSLIDLRISSGRSSILWLSGRSCLTGRWFNFWIVSPSGFSIILLFIGLGCWFEVWCVGS